jgi:4-carboxymuconolactone decarboxylase
MKFAKWILFACMALSMVGRAAAQDRMPPVPADKQTDAQKKATADLLSGPRSGLTGPFIPLLRSPELMDAFQKVGEVLRYHNSLGPKLTEFAIIMTARQWTVPAEWANHSQGAIKAGLSADIVQAVSEGRHPAAMAPDEEIVYDFAHELYQNQCVSDATYDRAVKKFGEQGVIDLTGTIGYYTALAMVLNVARTPAPPGKAPFLAPFPH